MKKITAILTLLLLSVSLLAGCGRPPEDTISPNTGLEPPETITIGYIAMTGSSPQALINREKKLFEKAFGDAGYQVEWVITRGRDNVGPLMEEGKFHFLYTPINNYTAYFTETSQFAAGNNYRIIAGSQAVREGSILLVNESISELKDLDGKTIGIVNNSYSHEMFLNLQLAKAGLSTETVGGSVKIQFQDYLMEFYEMFKNGEFDGIIARRREEENLSEQFPNAKKLLGLNDGNVAGELIPSVWLYARTDVLENWPDLVNIMLTTHIEATAVAEENREDLPRLAVDTTDYYYYEIVGASSYEQSPMEEIISEWERYHITYDPNEDFVQKLYTFIFDSGYTDKPYAEFADFRPLNTILGK
jgi:ABC-type nitrate/sulfonate/bicarbonate transport system substrate-binding protein